MCASFRSFWDALDHQLTGQLCARRGVPFVSPIMAHIWGGHRMGGYSQSTNARCSAPMWIDKCFAPTHELPGGPGAAGVFRPSSVWLCHSVIGSGRQVDPSPASARRLAASWEPTGIPSSVWPTGVGPAPTCLRGYPILLGRVHVEGALLSTSRVWGCHARERPSGARAAFGPAA